MQQTPLIEAHRRAHGKLVDFAGWEMPMQYSGVLDEYYAVRRQAGLFDVSHMGRIKVSGPGALAFLQRVTTNDVSALSVRHSQYSMICNPQGGILDDIFIYHVKPYEFLVCVNASNRAKIVAWLQETVAQAQNCKVQDQSQELAQIAIQGPASRDILTAAGVADLAALKVRQCVTTTLGGHTMVIARTGYTGEPGYELYVPADAAMDVWNRLLDVGSPYGLKPAGLGARDLLRLDMAYLLYGNDMDDRTTPLEAGAGWIVNFDKGDFIGRSALSAQKTNGLTKKLIAFELLEKAVPRHGFTIRSAAAPQQAVGVVTSGNLSPLLQKGIGLGYVPPALAEPGTSIAIDIRGKACPAVVVTPPFYKRPPTAAETLVTPIYKGTVVVLNVDRVRLPNGHTIDLEVIRHPGASAVVPLKEDGTVILIRQFRHAAGGFIYEIPAGKLHAKEDPLECAARELEEEIGYKAGKFELLSSIFTAPGFADEVIHVYVATALTKGTQNLDQDEVLDIVEMPLLEAIMKIEDGTIRDGKTIVGLQAVYIRQGIHRRST